MYNIYYTKRFLKSVKKVLSSGKIKNEEIIFVTDILSSGDKLPKKYKDHPLQGDYDGFRECHIKFDVLLVYKIKGKELILLIFDIGTHSNLF